jgi:hypothetical protein
MLFDEARGLGIAAQIIQIMVWIREIRFKNIRSQCYFLNLEVCSKLEIQKISAYLLTQGKPGMLTKPIQSAAACVQFNDVL